MDAQVRKAAEIADDILFPAALDVDRSDRVPAGHFAALARAGLYDLDGGSAAAVVEHLAGGCLATTFVWLQHHGPRSAAAAAGHPLAAALATGATKAGIAVSSIRGPAPLRIRATGDGYLLDGSVDWVTGWGLTDVVQVAALDSADVVHHLLVDARPAPTLTAGLVEVVTTRASRTATLTFTGHAVPRDRLLTTVPLAAWARNEASGSVLNGFLAIGVAARCCRLLGPTPLDDDLRRCRDALLAADGTGPVADARAAASDLVLRSSAALVVQTGSRSVRLDNQAQRLAREAIFLQTFGSRPTIRAALLDRLTRVARGPGSVSD